MGFEVPSSDPQALPIHLRYRMQILLCLVSAGENAVARP